jgi:hypothetical protein
MALAISGLDAAGLAQAGHSYESNFASLWRSSRTADVAQAAIREQRRTTEASLVPSRVASMLAYELQLEHT